MVKSNNVPEVITKSSRSESAKRMWEKRKQEQKMKGATMSSATTAPIKAWVYHSEWIALMTLVIGCFLFCYRESIHTNDRLDNHMEAINRRADDLSRESNKRADELHKEFYDLLKEVKRI